ncbi:response regulator transcription factor [Shewanella sp. NKUCC05_KAH]|jgi:two-component system response regulator CpxR|uniref:Response regulator transcription factor n=1 Tax=Shewanella oncorhynchi TaxID=2726434 RepID=A0AA50KHQ6_9GAMM|nr:MULTISPECIES: response regulator transcription factor [Shewanella]RBP78793.1 winged helix family two component transcriptional regulator [Shewanella putrefaciens]GCF88909.1 DNA-binding response regulator [Shewanella sp. M-Br]MBI1675494.1 response regulator transcription factor [Shewanella sp. DW31]MBS0043754.1 response regulator transcription factor [Shewanella sp. M16]MBW3525121.1 response regulator transcription factor [Shewanella sp. NKUCC05_KAH]
MSKILLVDDDPLFSVWLADALCTQGHEVKCAVNGIEGLACIESFAPDIIVLDLVMPQMNGFELLKARECSTPVLMISARDNEDDRITGYELGADDFLSKPFSIKEIFVRLRALERRLCAGHSHSPQMATVAAKVINFDEMSYRITIGTRYVDLTQTEFKLFKYLFERKGQVITKQELQRSVLQKDLGRFDRNLDMHISNTRRKLANISLPRNLINTVRGQGYSFMV